MIVTFKEPKLIGLERIYSVKVQDATLIPVDGKQCVQLIIKGMKWQPVMLLTDVLRFDVN